MDLVSFFSIWKVIGLLNIFAFGSLTVTKRAKSPFKATWLIYELTAGEFILVTAVKVTDSRVLNTIRSSSITWTYYFRYLIHHIFVFYFSILIWSGQSANGKAWGQKSNMGKQKKKTWNRIRALSFYFPWREWNRGGSPTRGQIPVGVEGSSTPCSSHTNSDFITRYKKKTSWGNRDKQLPHVVPTLQQHCNRPDSEEKKPAISQFSHWPRPPPSTPPIPSPSKKLVFYGRLLQMG